MNPTFDTIFDKISNAIGDICERTCCHSDVLCVHTVVFISMMCM